VLGVFGLVGVDDGKGLFSRPIYTMGRYRGVNPH